VGVDGYRIYYTLVSSGITNYIDFSSNSGYIYNLLSEEYKFQIASFIETNLSNLSSNLYITPISGTFYEQTSMKIALNYYKHTNETGKTSTIIKQNTRYLAQQFNNLAVNFNIQGLFQDAKNIINITNKI